MTYAIHNIHTPAVGTFEGRLIAKDQNGEPISSKEAARND